MSDHRSDSPAEGHLPDASDAKTAKAENTFVLLDECLSTLPDDSPQQELLYRVRHRLLQEGATHERREMELKKLGAVVEKLTAPANRVGTLLDVPTEGIARIVVRERR